MKLKGIFLILLSLTCLPCIAIDEPCSDSYWVALQSAYPVDGDVSPGNPLNDTEGATTAGVPWPIYTPRPDNRFHIEGNLLMRRSMETGESEVYDELVFLRGAGEYYEFYWKVIKNDSAVAGTEYDKAMKITSQSGFNMIRQFVYSGFHVRDNYWLYPFELSTSYPTKYALHYYNEEYFDELNNLISAADDAGITVLLTLFDFTEDIVNEDAPSVEEGTPTPTSPPEHYHPSAWNPDYNIYHPAIGATGYKLPDTYTVYNFGTQFFNIGTAENLNFLGKTQRDFVLKVVRETRHHPNVIYEIANEPKVDDTSVSDWADIVASWIKDGVSGCEGSEHSLVAITEADDNAPDAIQTPPGWDPYNAANTALLRSSEIDIFSRHNCYHGAKTLVDFSNNQTPTPVAVSLPSPFDDDDVRFWQEAKMLEADYLKTTEDPPMPKAFLVDTDGAHRGGWNADPKYRDSDVLCQHWANIAYIMGASFNTKDTLGMAMDYTEKDSAPPPSTDMNFPGYADGFWTGAVPTSQPIPDRPYSGCDDFWWEKNDFFNPAPPNTQLNFKGLDVHLGHSLCGPYFNPSTPTPSGYTAPSSSINFKPYIQWVTFSDNPIVSGKDFSYHTYRGSINGFGKGSQLQDYAYVLNADDFSGVPWNPTTPTPTPATPSTPINTPMPGGEAFFSKGNINSYNVSFSPAGGNEFWVLMATLDTTVATPVPSSVWPWLEVQDNSMCNPTPGPTPDTCPNITDIISSGNTHIVEATPPPIVARLDCFEDPISAQNGNDASVEIVGMGWGYSNINNGYYTGLFQLSFILRYTSKENPPDGVYVAESTDPTNGGYVALEFFNESDPGSGYKTLTLTGPILGGYWEGNYGYLLYDFALADYDKNNDVWSIGDNAIWPRLHVSEKSATTKYIIAGQSNQNADGSILNPFGSVSEAVKWFDSEYNGSIDKEHPVELVMLPGQHEVNSSNKIELPSFYELTGEDGAEIVLSQSSGYGDFIHMGHGSVVRNLKIECGVRCEHSRAYIDNCVFTMPNVSGTPTPTPTSTTTPISGFGAAVVVDGHHDLHVRNCLFDGHDFPVFAGGESVLKISNCTIANGEAGILLSDETIAKISNCIFYNISNGSSDAVAIDAESDSYGYVESCAFYGNDTNYDEQNGAELNCQTQSFITDNPLFVDATNGDFHLTQTTVRSTVSQSNTSPCVNAGTWNGFITGSTAIDCARDADQDDIGYHYSSELTYNFPRFKADDGANTDYWTEIAIYNPSEYTQNLSIQCTNLAGTEQDFNGATDGNILKLELEAGATWFRVLKDSCSVGDDECIEAPCSEGSITIESDGPLFGQYRIVESNATTGTSSWMLQMQRADLADDGGSNTTLSCDSWVSNFGGGSNTIETEIVLHNLTNESNTVSGTVYNNQGTPVPSDSFTMELDPGETDSITFDSSSTIDYGNMEFSADGPVTGEMIYHCQNQNSDHNFSEGVILLPSTYYSDTLTAPFVQIENFGTNLQESYVCLKNPNNTSISAYIDIFDDQGDSIYTAGTPTPTPIPIPAHGSRCIGSYNFPVDWGSYSVEIDIAGTDKVIGHQEVLIYESTNDDFTMAGCELDHHLEVPNRFFVPYCTLNNATGQDYEATWIVLRNNSTSSSVSMDLEIFDFEGTSLDDTTINLGAQEIILFSFGSSPALLDPGTENQFVLTIEANDIISGWVELYRVNANGDDMAYDSNKLHSW